ncbi:MAG: hypothetical protein FJ279_00895 [Planctomycetes bacterium]|nr:hypothetical protein [Planctomycetota bacterium]
MRALREPKALAELHRIREEMQAEEDRVGSETFWAEVNRRAEGFFRAARRRRAVTGPTQTHFRAKLPVPQVMKDLHKIREQMYREAAAVGIERYYEALNKRSERSRRQRKKAQAVQVAERPARYGRSRRRRS